MKLYNPNHNLSWFFVVKLYVFISSAERASEALAKLKTGRKNKKKKKKKKKKNEKERMHWSLKSAICPTDIYLIRELNEKAVVDWLPRSKTKVSDHRI